MGSTIRFDYGPPESWPAVVWRTIRAAAEATGEEFTRPPRPEPGDRQVVPLGPEASGAFLLAQFAESGHWPAPLASLRPEAVEFGVFVRAATRERIAAATPSGRRRRLGLQLKRRALALLEAAEVAWPAS